MEIKDYEYGFLDKGEIRLRNIRFRGYSREDKKWYEGIGVITVTKDFYEKDDTYIFENEYYIIEDNEGIYNKVDPSTIGEFTGLYDKNDTPIYENDNIKIYNKMEILFEGKVIYKNAEWKIKLEDDSIIPLNTYDNANYVVRR